MFYRGLYRENKIFSCRKLLGQRALILCMKHHLVNLYQVCSSYAPGGQKISYVLLIDLYREKMRFYSILLILLTKLKVTFPCKSLNETADLLDFGGSYGFLHLYKHSFSDERPSA